MADNDLDGLLNNVPDGENDAESLLSFVLESSSSTTTPDDPDMDILQNIRQLNYWSHKRVVTEYLRVFQCEPTSPLMEHVAEINKIVFNLAHLTTHNVVKLDMLKSVPLIAQGSTKLANTVPALENVVGDYLLPLTVANIAEREIMNAAQTSFLALLEQGFVSRTQAEVLVLPTVLAATRTSSTDIVVQLISFVGHMVPLLGRDIAERVLLERFIELCESKDFAIKKYIALNICNFCKVASKSTFDNKLLPCFTRLCNDDNWSVRKACADTIMSLTTVCTTVQRQTILAPIFVKLLDDPSRWVLTSAFQVLGPFISTFADTNLSNNLYNNVEKLDVANRNETAYYNPFVEDEPSHDSRRGQITYLMRSMMTTRRIINNQSAGGATSLADRYELGNNYNGGSTHEDLNNCGRENVDDDGLVTNDCYDDTNVCDGVGAAEVVIPFNAAEDVNRNDSDDSAEVVANNESDGTGDDDEVFKSIGGNPDNGVVDNNQNAQDDNELSVLKDSENNVERAEQIGDNAVIEDRSVSTIDLSDKSHVLGDEERGDAKSVNNIEKIPEMDDDLQSYNSYYYWFVDPNLPLDPLLVNSAKFGTSSVAPTDTPGDCGDSLKLLIGDSVKEKKSAHQQDVVPQILIDHFVSMIRPELAQSVDGEIALYCAYSLPAVVLTLGSKNWNVLKETTEALAASAKYKVRKTLASSLHDLALILGPDIASESLIPIFDAFIQDVDEVRIGILKNLAHFLRLLKPKKRPLCLPRLMQFLEVDNDLNWRLKYELAEQLLLAVPLLKPVDAGIHVGRIGQTLLGDKVAAVREMGIKLTAVVIKHVSRIRGAMQGILVALAEEFAHSKNWKRRQTYCLLCSEWLRHKSLSLDQYAADVLPHFLDLSWDPVANIRLVVARIISKDIVSHEYFMDPNNQQVEVLQSIIRRLQNDNDRDVKDAATILEESTLQH